MLLPCACIILLRTDFLVHHSISLLVVPKNLPEKYICLAQSVDVLQSIRFLTLQLQVDSKGTLLLVASHPDILITGIAEAFEALLAVLPLQKAELKVKACPLGT